MFLALGPHPLANGFLTYEQLAVEEPKYPLDVYSCLSCGLIQIKDNVPANFFRQYVYIPSASDVMQRHFAGLADVIAGEFLPNPKGLTVDIGCNDGLLLKCLATRGARGLGIDPATNIVEMAKDVGVEVINEYFDPAIARQVRQEYGPAAVIVTTNTFHHIGDLDPFTQGVRLLLDDDGVFVIELPHALEIVDLNQFDGVYHEHVSQFTVKSLVDHARLFGLEVFRVDPLAIHGGSIRVFMRKAHPHANGMSSDVQEWVRRECEKRLLEAETYDHFRDRVQRIRHDLMVLLTNLKASGQRLAGYGSSARGNTLLNYYGIGPEMLDYIVDRNTLKHGLYTPGMHIPVAPVERLVEDLPDSVLILAWNFADEILCQQSDYRQRGGRFVIPIPEPKLVA
jgi:SAM-dependent methyltransferase